MMSPQVGRREQSPFVESYVKKDVEKCWDESPEVVSKLQHCGYLLKYGVVRPITSC